MKVIVIGANGQLGSDVVDVFSAAGHDVHAANHDRIDIADAERLRGIVAEVEPDVVVNTAAMHQLEACEADIARTLSVNAIGPRNLAELAAQHDFLLIHISTDYVFDGLKGAPYVETDAARPLNAYGTTKLAGELFVRQHAPRHFVVRTSAIYGARPCRAKAGLNFVRLMLKLAREKGVASVVTDQVVSPTYTSDLARQLLHLTDRTEFGVVHATSQGECSWFDYARTIFELAGLDVDLKPVTSAGAVSKVPRPPYSVLDNAALRNMGADIMPSWRDSLERYLRDIGELA